MLGLVFRGSISPPADFSYSSPMCVYVCIIYVCLSKLTQKIVSKSSQNHLKKLPATAVSTRPCTDPASFRGSPPPACGTCSCTLSTMRSRGSRIRRPSALWPQTPRRRVARRSPARGRGRRCVVGVGLIRRAGSRRSEWCELQRGSRSIGGAVDSFLIF
jgi:hypothetical protein